MCHVLTIPYRPKPSKIQTSKFLENIYLKEFSFKLSPSGNGYACADVDECREGIDMCDKNAKCTNNIGSYTCACNNGYRG